MKIGFFGTPEIASFCLEYLARYFSIVFVITSPDKPKGRGKHLASPPVKQKAVELAIPVYQPVSLNDESLINTLANFKCDIFVVVAYGKLIPSSIFMLPPLGTINLHPSLLPKYRGAAPIEWAIYNGEKQTGVTIQLINEELDAGDIVLQLPVTIAQNDTALDMYNKIMPLGAEMLVKAIEGLQNKTIVPIKQDHSQASYCGKISTHTAHIDWCKPAIDIHNIVRAFNPKPGAWTTFRGKVIKIWKTQIPEIEHVEGAPGMLFTQSKRLFVCTGKGIIEVLMLQPETKKPMDAIAFLNGYRLQQGDSFI